MINRWLKDSNKKIQSSSPTNTYLYFEPQMGTMFQVLLPVDVDEDRAFAAAQAITSLPDGKKPIQVTILNVQEKVDVADDSGGASSETWYNEHDFPESVTKVEEFLKNSGFVVEKRREHSDPAKKIIEIANEINADRIVMSGRKKSPVGKVLFGSVTQAVLLNGNVPVTVIAV